MSLLLTDSQQKHVKGKRILVMGSGNGSNFEALVRTLRPLGIIFPGLFCDQPQASIIERAKKLAVPYTIPSSLPTAEKSSQIALNDDILGFLKQPFDLLALAGYMRILPKRVVQRYEGKIINIHPSLLPAYRGLHAIERAYQANEKTMGVTVHLVDEWVDHGTILEQASLERKPGESLTSITTKIHQLEHKLYPKVLLSLLCGQTTEASRATDL